MVVDFIIFWVGFGTLAVLVAVFFLPHFARRVGRKLRGDDASR